MANKNSETTPKCYIHENIREYRKKEIFKSVCSNLSAEYLFKGNCYCILHSPDENKNKELFIIEINKRKDEKNFDFRAVYFPVYVEFSDFTFENIVDFRSATFQKNVSFIGATFMKEARFSWAHFQADTFFDLVVFKKKALFDSSVFGKDSDVNFRGVTFQGTADFSYATFSGFIEFGRKDKRYSREEDIKINKYILDKEDCLTTFKTRLKLQHIRLESPNKITFHSVRLRPYWFINTEATKFIFTNCRWKLYSEFDEKDTSVESELSGLRYLKIQQPHKLLTKTFWQLADNHEESKSFPKASVFRKFAQEARRKEDYGGWKLWTWHWWYWLSSLYGESPLRAGSVLLLILLFFVIAYMFTDFKVFSEKNQLNFYQAILQSIATATFQNIEFIKPESNASILLVIMEKIFAPLQAALLALAIRRKFMR